MRKNWYVVAHRSGARIFEQTGVRAELSMVSSFEHPEGRMREGELNADREGRALQTMGTGFNEYSPHQTQRQHAMQTFAKQISANLQEACRNQKFDQLVLVAEPHLLGVLRDSLDKSLQSKVRLTVSKDLANVADRDMVGSLKEALLVKEPIA